MNQRESETWSTLLRDTLRQTKGINIEYTGVWSVERFDELLETLTMMRNQWARGKTNGE